MKKIIAAAAGIVAFTMASSAMANPMVGTWTWDAFTVTCAEGGANGLSCKVTDGPKNKGMEMIMSKIEKKGDAFVGKVKHPGDGKVYNAQMKFDGNDKVNMTGVTDDGTKATGTFTRKK